MRARFARKAAKVIAPREDAEAGERSMSPEAEALRRTMGDSTNAAYDPITESQEMAQAICAALGITEEMVTRLRVLVGVPDGNVPFEDVASALAALLEVADG